MDNPLTWVEVSRSSISHNIAAFKKLIGKKRILCAAVKANAYGHGLQQCAPVMLEAGADWLGVNALFEAMSLRAAGIKAPVYIMGYIPVDELSTAVVEGFHFVVYNEETLHALARITKKLSQPAFTHLKVETGIYRQGAANGQLQKILRIYKENPLVKLEGIAAHFANIEDTTDHSYALFQLNNFNKTLEQVKRAGLKVKYVHMANTAATILFPKTYFNMVRTGIGNYGMWPSNETYISSLREGKKIELKSALVWKTKVAQVKIVPSGSTIGYGCTYKTTRPSKIAVLPVGYYDGYDRGLSNNGYVLIHGKRAHIRGRVCMNMVMVDVTDIPDVQMEDEAVLLGKQEKENITPDQMAGWLGTINYEVTTRIHEMLTRKVVK